MTLTMKLIEEETRCQKSVVVVIIICQMTGMEQVLDATGPVDILMQKRAKNCSEALQS